MINSAAFDAHLGVAVLRVPEGFDFTGLISEFDGPIASHPAGQTSPSPTAVAETRSITPVPSSNASPPAGKASSSTSNLNPNPSSSLKPSSSSSSGWQENDGARPMSRSQDSLHSHGKSRSIGKFNEEAADLMTCLRIIEAISTCCYVNKQNFHIFLCAANW